MPRRNVKKSSRDYKSFERTDCVNRDHYDNIEILEYFQPSKTIGKTLEQKDYIKSIKGKDLVICHGVAGTGKTHIATGLAIDYLYDNQSMISKIVIARPMVGAGEHSGYLPGNIDEKSKPYMMPIYDCICEKFSEQEADKLINSLKEENKLEVVPLEYMKGRTFKNSFVILDEAQNATYAQIKMFLTRLGCNSKMVITGDPAQKDIQDSGFATIIDKLSGIDAIDIVLLTKVSIQRHAIVSLISDLI